MKSANPQRRCQFEDENAQCEKVRADVGAEGQNIVHVDGHLMHSVGDDGDAKQTTYLISELQLRHTETWMNETFTSCELPTVAEPRTVCIPSPLSQ